MNKVFAFTVGRHQPATLESLLVSTIHNVQVFNLTNSHKYHLWIISTVNRNFSGRQPRRGVKALPRISDWLFPYLQSLKPWRIFTPWCSCLPEKISLNYVAAKASRLKSVLGSLFGRLHVLFSSQSQPFWLQYSTTSLLPSYSSRHLYRSVTALFHIFSFTQNHAVCSLWQ
jgi:hypothetical protein